MKLFGLLVGVNAGALAVKVQPGDTVDQIKKAILKETKGTITCGAGWLQLYCTKTTASGEWLASLADSVKKIRLGHVPDEIQRAFLSQRPLDPGSKIKDHFANAPRTGTIHFLVVFPQRWDGPESNLEQLGDNLMNRTSQSTSKSITNSLKLECSLVGLPHRFSVTVDPSQSVAALKKAIHKGCDVLHCSLREIQLYRARGESSNWLQDDDETAEVLMYGSVPNEILAEDNIMMSSRRVDVYFPTLPPTESVHVVVVAPIPPCLTLIDQNKTSERFDIEEGDSFDSVKRRVRDDLGFMFGLS